MTDRQRSVRSRLRAQAGYVLTGLGLALWLAAILTPGFVSTWYAIGWVGLLTPGVVIAGALLLLVGLLLMWSKIAVVVAMTVVPLTAWGIAAWAVWSPIPFEQWFADHREQYETALAIDPGDEYYGAPLPAELRHLTVTGKVSGTARSPFFPQWTGIPDDAGGYFYSPGRSPEWRDMYGMICQDPVSLGDGWWACGMGG